MRDSAIGGERLLEGADLRAENVPAALQHRREPALDLRQKRAVMATQIVDEKPLSFLEVHNEKNGYYSLATHVAVFARITAQSIRTCPARAEWNWWGRR